ncbi:flippase-like domain-containing protein [bacterium]|nr:flippase-like domain-containing protein [bacterium]
MRKSVIYFLITIFISGILIYFVFEKIGMREIWEEFLSFPSLGIFLVSILTLFFVLIGIWRWKIILQYEKENISPKDLIPLWLAGFGISYFTPFAIFGGEGTKIYYLKKNFSLPWKVGVISVFIDKIFEVSIFFLIVISGIIFFILKTFTVPSRFWTIFLIILFPAIALLLFYVRAFKKQSIIKLFEKPLKGFINEKATNEISYYEKEMFDFFKTSNKNMWKVLLLSFLKGVVNWLRSWAILWFLGIRVNGIVTLSVMAFTNLSYLFPLPAALGSHEALQIFSFSLLGLPGEKAIAFTMILRAVDVLVAILGILMLFRLGTKWVGKIKNKT